jgi:hypothetical protein
MKTEEKRLAPRKLPNTAKYSEIESNIKEELQAEGFI